MLKPFSKLGQIECGLLDIAAGKTCALTPVVHEHAQGLGLAVANEPGYYPIPLHWCHGDNRDELQKHADELNAELFGIDRRAALEIVCSSMFPRR